MHIVHDTMGQVKACLRIPVGVQVAKDGGGVDHLGRVGLGVAGALHAEAQAGPARRGQHALQQHEPLLIWSLMIWGGWDWG